MKFIENALGMIGDAATGGLANGIGSFVSGLFGGGGIDYHDQKKLMEKQHGYELENMDYQAKLNEEMAQRNQERQNRKTQKLLEVPTTLLYTCPLFQASRLSQRLLCIFCLLLPFVFVFVLREVLCFPI